MPTLPEYDAALIPRVVFLLRVEALINIGCKYGPGDLEAQTWDHLLILGSERAFVDRLVDGRRNKRQQSEAEMSKARQQTGVPAPGGTLFKTTKPFHGSTR